MLDNKKYLNNPDGNVAMMFAISLMVIFMGAGVAYDSFGTTKQFQHTQHLADMAALAAATSGEQELVDIQQVAENSINANAGIPNDYTAIATITPENAIQVTVSKTYEMQFMGTFGHGNKSITALAEAPPRGDGKLNLALVLDTTGSMEGSKLTALQTAANELIDTFETPANASSSDNVMISVVPFARYVRIPMTYIAEPWLEVQPTSENTWNHDLNGCGDNDDDGEIDDPSCVPNNEERTATISWSGCMGSREAPWNTRAHYNPGKKLQGFAGGGSCHTEMLPLTSDMEAVKSTISSFEAEDKTYIPSGLMWGWRTLTPEAPLVEANTPDRNDRKSALLLMTDGNNTRSHGGTNDSFNGVFHWNSDQADADATTTEICTKIKEDDIIIYTVAFEVTDAATLTMLQGCATDSGKYFNAGDAIALEDAFGAIGQELAEVRLSK